MSSESQLLIIVCPLAHPRSHSLFMIGIDALQRKGVRKYSLYHLHQHAAFRFARYDQSRSLIQREIGIKRNAASIGMATVEGAAQLQQGEHVLLKAYVRIGKHNVLRLGNSRAACASAQHTLKRKQQDEHGRYANTAAHRMNTGVQGLAPLNERSNNVKCACHE